MHATLNCYSNVKNIDYGITSLNKGVMKVIYYLLHLLSILVNGYNSSNGIKGIYKLLRQTCVRYNS